MYFRDALSDLAIHFLDKIKTMVIKDIEREDIEFVCKTLGCRPIASLDHFTAENLVNVDLVEEVNEPSGRYIKVNNNFFLNILYVEKKLILAHFDIII